MKNWLIRIVVVLIFLILGIVIGIFGDSVWAYIYNSPTKDNAFVKACAQLNGKQFTLKNIQTLHGVCYENTPAGYTTTTCSASHITTYNSEKTHIVPFNVSQRGLDNSWRCEFEQTSPIIKAFPYFAAD